MEELYGQFLDIWKVVATIIVWVFAVFLAWIFWDVKRKERRENLKNEIKREIKKEQDM